MRFLRQVFAIVQKDLAAELRTKENLSAMVVFSLLVLVIFNFAFELQGVDITVLGSGILWVAFTFSGILGLGRKAGQQGRVQPLDAHDVLGHIRVLEDRHEHDKPADTLEPVPPGVHRQNNNEQGQDRSDSCG